MSWITVENAFRSVLRSNNILHLCHMKRKRKNEGDEPLKDSTYCCAKTSLKSILRYSQYQFKFEDVVIRCNIIVTEAYQFIRLYCLHAYSMKKDLPNASSNTASKLSASAIHEERKRLTQTCNKNCNIFMKSILGVFSIIKISTICAFWHTSHTWQRRC